MTTPMGAIPSGKIAAEGSDVANNGQHMAGMGQVSLLQTWGMVGR